MDDPIPACFWFNIFSSFTVRLVHNNIHYYLLESLLCRTLYAYYSTVAFIIRESRCFNVDLGHLLHYTMLFKGAAYHL